MNNTGVLLIQLGTPDSDKQSDVKQFLKEFLLDWRVIDYSKLKREILTRGVIIPFRLKNSTQIYQELWKLGGGESPLIVHSNKLKNKLSQKLNGQADVYLAMRYRNPSIASVLEEMRIKNYEKIIVLPLYPQYASSSSGTAVEEVMKTVQKWWVTPNIEFINQFWDCEGYQNSMIENAQALDYQKYDHILFSYHGLPISQVNKAHSDQICANHPCETELNAENKYCYKATCYATTRALVKKLGLTENQYTVCFQSRLNEQWISPYSDVMIQELAKKGKRNLLVFSPAFVADCLETLVEIGVEYQSILDENGGGNVQLVPSCNDSDTFVNGLAELLQKAMN